MILIIVKYYYIGNSPEKFINSFINIYSDIWLEDKFRYKIEKSNLNKIYDIYKIKARTAKYNLIVICFPTKFEEGEFINDFLDIYDKELIPKKINYIFIPMEKNMNCFKMK